MKSPIILFDSKKYTIHKISECEISIDNKITVSFAYLGANKKTLLFDVINCPKYIQKIALRLARKNIKSIYA
jgi:hypothetical protein